MNWLKLGAAAFGVLITVVAAFPDANATTISPAVTSGHVIDGEAQIDAWSTEENGQIRNQKKLEATQSWNFTPVTQDATATGAPNAPHTLWLTSKAVDGLTTSGEWVLSATSHYYHKAKRMIEFGLADFFFARVAASNASAEKVANVSSDKAPPPNVPPPSDALPILAGIVLLVCVTGIVAITRRQA